jgi:hypothetical protein
MKVETEIDVYETDGKELKALSGKKFKLRSHWNRTADLVVIELEEGHTITVLRKDLVNAISSVTFSSYGF